MQAKLDQLTADYEAADQEMRNAKDEAERGKLKLELAARLIKALGSEKARWSEGIASLQVRGALRGHRQHDRLLPLRMEVHGRSGHCGATGSMVVDCRASGGSAFANKDGLYSQP